MIKSVHLNFMIQIGKRHCCNYFKWPASYLFKGSCNVIKTYFGHEKHIRSFYTKQDHHVILLKILVNISHSERDMSVKSQAGAEKLNCAPPLTQFRVTVSPSRNPLNSNFLCPCREKINIYWALPLCWAPIYCFHTVILSQNCFKVNINFTNKIRKWGI